MSEVKLFTDHLGYMVSFTDTPSRIVSLVPSITETLFELELGDSIVGRTKFCIHPEDQVSSAAKIGGTKTPDFDKIKSLEPDLIIANKEENSKEDIEKLQEHFTVWISEIGTIDKGIKLIKELGMLLNVLPLAVKLTKNIANEQKELNRKKYKPARVAYIIWNNPLMTVGRDTFIHSSLELCGFTNIFGDQTRYPQITMEDLSAAQPDYIFLSSEPFPFAEKHKTEFESHVSETEVILVDGEMFSWYGSRILKALPYYRSLQDRLLTEIHLNVN